jgi:hypothetical protein
MKIGYAKETPRLAIGPQIDALKDNGAETIWRNDDLPLLIGAIRPGDDIVVQRVSLLGQKRKKLEANIREIFRLGGSITELETGRTSIDKNEWESAIEDAFAELAGKRVFNPGQPGRLPKRTLTEAERLKAEAIWFKPYANNETRVQAVLKAIGEPFDYHFGYRLFGKPSARPE